jgi:CHAD domain-containing protein
MRSGSSTRRAIHRRLRTLDRDLLADIDTDVEALHQARVATRRLREALPLAAHTAPDPEERRALLQVKKIVHDVTRALGAVRELDVALAIVDECAAREPGLLPAATLVRPLIEQDRTVRLAETRDRLDVARFRKASRHLAQFTRPGPEGDAPHARLAPRVAGRSRALRTAVAEAGVLYASDRLHAVRLAVKKLRYTLELAEEIDKCPARHLIVFLKHTQDVLGRIHDLDVVARYTRLVLARPDLAGEARSAAARLLETIEQEIRERHADYLVGRDGLAEAAGSARQLGVRSKSAASRP